MSFTITIVAESAKLAIAELIHAAEFYRANPNLSSGAVPEAAAAVVSPDETPAKPARVRPAKIAPPGGTPAPAGAPSGMTSPAQEAAAAPAPLPASGSPSAGAPSAASTDTTPTPAEQAPPTPATAEVTLAQVRALLSPLLSDPAKSPKVAGLIQKHSPTGRLSDVSDLAALVAEAKTVLEVT